MTASSGAARTMSFALCTRIERGACTAGHPDDVYRAARIRAAERGTSVSSMVGDYLRSLSEREAEFSRLEAQQRRIQEEIHSFSAGDRLHRDELHDRAVR
jgi:plasmid stability protein